MKTESGECVVSFRVSALDQITPRCDFFYPRTLPCWGKPFKNKLISVYLNPKVQISFGTITISCLKGNEVSVICGYLRSQHTLFQNRNFTQMPFIHCKYDLWTQRCREQARIYFPTGATHNGAI